METDPSRYYKDFCREILGETAVKNILQLALLSIRVTRRIGKIAEDIERQLLERMNILQWYEG